MNEKLREDIPRLNLGGCGVFAYHTVKALREKGYDARIKILDNWGDVETHNLKKEYLNIVNNVYDEVPKYATRDTSFNHCFVEVEGLQFDGLYKGSDMWNRWGLAEGVGEYSLEEMKTALKIGSWNDMYERENTPELKRLIKESFGNLPMAEA